MGLLSSLILAWLAVLFTVLSAVLYFIKRSGNRRLRRAFSRIHITVGILLIVTGIVHGVLAGNPSGATLSDMMLAPVLFTWNWGTLSLIAAILLAATYLLRRILKKRWIVLHRVLTVALVAMVALHMANVGIQLDDRLAAVVRAETMTVETATATPIPTLSPTEASAEATAVSATATATTAAAATATATATAAIVEQANETFSGATLIDGVYEGSASGYNGTVTVSVTVSGGLVTDITVVSERDTPAYFNRAESVIDTIVDEQSLEVDAVSGATYSSAGIVNAVADALSSAVDSGTLDVTTFTFSNIGHGGHGGH